MLGTIVNVLAVFLGGAAGTLIKSGLSERFKLIVMQAVGMAVMFIGLSGALSKLLLPEANPILFILSLVIGGIAGEAAGIESKLEKLGDYLQKKFSGHDRISQGFVSASLLFCVGTMAILGSLESGISGVHTTLFAKSVLDGVTSVIFASSMGIGVVLSGFTILVYQGSLTLLAGVIGPFLTQDMIREISIVGGILITGLGLNLLGIKKIKVGNLLPSVLVPVIYYFVYNFKN